MKRLAALFLMPSLLLVAADPQGLAPFRLLPLDTRTGMAVADLRPAELTVKLGGEARKVLRIEPFAPEVAVRWILLFEPFQESRHRAVAFLAAAEFLRQIPEGDQALLIVREGEGYRPLAPRFSLNRASWSQQLGQVPGLLSEYLRSAAKAGIRLNLEDAQVEAAGDAKAGADAIQGLIKKINADPVAFAKGTVENVSKVNTSSEGYWASAASQAQVIRQEMEALTQLLDQLAGLSGDKHLVIFSRSEADLYMRPDHLTPKWEQTVMGNSIVRTPNTSQQSATQPLLMAREAMKESVRKTGLMVHSVAGSAINDQGFFGDVALSTGGQAFSVTNGLENRLPGALLVYRNCVLVTLDGPPPAKASSVDLNCSRANTKLIAPRLR